MKINAVFEGGGVRAAGHVGAILATEAHYGAEAPGLFGRLAGTSGGAVIASLLAAGYTGSGLKEIMYSVDYRRFEDKDWLQEFPLLGAGLGVALEEGIYKGGFLFEWMDGNIERLLGKRGATFGDLKQKLGITEQTTPETEPLQIVASDITRGQKIVLPQAISAYEGYEPDTLPIALAVRMSSSIPFFFEPVKLKEKATGRTCFIVDGGLLSDYPLDLVNTDDQCTLGYRLVGPMNSKGNDIRGPVSMLAALVSTLFTGYDNFYIDDKKFANTIAIETFGSVAGATAPIRVNATDFGIGKPELDMLLENGQKAADKFLAAMNADTPCRPASQAGPSYSRHETLRAVQTDRGTG